jgi:tetratricopeptide (TPR) repeat protein
MAHACRVPRSVPRVNIVDLSTRRARKEHIDELWHKLKDGRRARSSPSHSGVALQRQIRLQLRGVMSRFRSALRRSELVTAFQIVRNLFFRLHYEKGGYIDNADLLLRFLSKGEPLLRNHPHLTVEATALPTTGSMVTVQHGHEKECPVAWCFTALGVTYRALWAPSEARKCFTKAQSIYRRCGVVGGEIVNAINLADVAWERADLDTAYSHLSEANRLSTQTGNKALRAIVQQDLGLRLAFAAKWNDSTRHLRNALRDSKRDRHRRSIIMAHWTRRDVLFLRWLTTFANPEVSKRLRNVLKSARQHVEKASGLLHFRGVERHRVRIQWLKGVVLLLEGSPAQARRGLYRALRSSRKLALSEFEADIILDLARCEQCLCRLSTAEALAREALDIAIMRGTRLQEIEALLVLGNILGQTGNVGQMRRELSRAMRILNRYGRRKGHLRPAVALRQASVLLRNNR